MDDAVTIAAGGEPAFTLTLDHPKYGELTFTAARTPTVADWLRQGVEQAQLAPGITAGGDLGAMELAASVAGIRTMMNRPVIHEERVEDPDTPGHLRIEQTFYEPLEDEDLLFPLQVWRAFMAWRGRQLDSTEQVKNSSGATSSRDSDASSPGPTASPPTTPESAT